MDIEEIRNKVKTDKKLDWYTELIRRFSPYFDWIFIRLGMTANQVTLLSIIPIIIGCSLFLLSNPIYWILGWIVMQLYCIIDCCDGEIARYRNSYTKFGFVIDEFFHPVVNSLVIIFATLGLFLIYENIYVLVFGFSALLFNLLNRLLKLSFSSENKKIIKDHVGGGRVPLGGLVHIFLIPSLLDTFLSEFRLLTLFVVSIFLPIVFAQNLTKIKRSDEK